MKIIITVWTILCQTLPFHSISVKDTGKFSREFYFECRLGTRIPNSKVFLPPFEATHKYFCHFQITAEAIKSKGWRKSRKYSNIKCVKLIVLSNAKFPKNKQEDKSEGPCLKPFWCFQLRPRKESCSVAYFVAGKTRNVDTTLTNLLDGTIAYTPLSEEEQTKEVGTNENKLFLESKKVSWVVLLVSYLITSTEHYFICGNFKIPAILLII